MSENLLEIKNLFVEYKADKGILGGTLTIHAVNGVNLDVKKGEYLLLQVNPAAVNQL